MKNSIRTRLIIILTIFIVIFVALNIFMNITFLERYYAYEKKDGLVRKTQLPMIKSFKCFGVHCN